MHKRIDTPQPNARCRPIALWILSLLCLLARGTASARQAQALAQSPDSTRLNAPYSIGDPVSHVRCEPGYTATLYARGLRSPDGLAFAPSGLLHVVEEGANRVSRVEPDGRTTPILRGLRSPEGIAFDEAGNLYVVEDVQNGRLVKQTPDGQVIPLAQGLQAPEGVAVGLPEAGRPAPTLYVTESNVQFVRSPYDLLTGIAAVTSTGDVTHVITHTPTLNGSTITFWSYAGLATGPDGRLYVTNELSRQKITREIVLLPGVLTYTATLFTGDSIFAIDPIKGARELVASGLLAPEGLSFSADGGFPLYVAEENVSNQGRLSQVEADGQRTTVCDGFRGVEDVTVDANGDLYVSEDLSGYVIRIQGTDEVASATVAPPTSQRPADTPAPDKSQPPSSANKGSLHRIWAQIAAVARWIARRLERLLSTG